MKTFKESLDEAPMVSTNKHIVQSVLDKIEPMLVKDLDKGKTEVLNNIARLVKLKVTRKGQAKGKAYRYDLK